MDRTTLAKAASPILLVTAFVVGGLAAGSVPYQEGSPPVREFFERLVERSGTSRPPTPDEVGKIGDRIDSAAREEISDALPAIFAAAGHNDPTVKGFAVLALWAVSQRPDRYELLSKYLRGLTGLISSDDARDVAFVVMTLANVWPQPPPEVLPRLLDYLRRQDADWRTQADVLRYVVRGAPDHPEAVAAVLEFWSRPMDTRARIAAINGLANGHPKDPRLIKLLISSLDAQAFEVRSAAFQRLAHIGPAALQQAKLPMQRVAGEYVNLLGQKDADPNMQIDAIHNLLFYAPDDPQVLNALVEFYSRPLDRGARTVALDALRSTRIKDVRLIDFVIASLHDPYPEVRTNAAYVLKDMGPRALLRAEPALKKVAEDPAEPAEVKEGASRALKEIPEVTH